MRTTAAGAREQLATCLLTYKVVFVKESGHVLLITTFQGLGPDVQPVLSVGKRETEQPPGRWTE